MLFKSDLTVLTELEKVSHCECLPPCSDIEYHQESSYSAVRRADLLDVEKAKQGSVFH